MSHTKPRIGETLTVRETFSEKYGFRSNEISVKAYYFIDKRFIRKAKLVKVAFVFQ